MRFDMSHGGDIAATAMANLYRRTHDAVTCPAYTAYMCVCAGARICMRVRE